MPRHIPVRDQGDATDGNVIQTRASIWAYLRRLNTDDGLTLFITTHYLEEANHLCDRLAIIDHGDIVASGSPDQLKAGLGGDVIRLVFREEPGAPSDLIERAGQALRQKPFVRSLVQDDHTLVLAVENGGRVLPGIIRDLDDIGVPVDDLSLPPPTLDEVCLKLTGTRIREGEPVRGWRNQRGPMAMTRGMRR